MPIYDTLLTKGLREAGRSSTYLPGAVPWEEFKTSYVEKEAAPKSALWRILQILSAGEYGVANALKSLVRSQSYEGEDDPFTAFWKGFRSAFTDERKYNTTFWDVLSELGWEPQNTSEKVAKGVLSFVGSVLIDPVSYIGFGARGLKIGGETLKSVTESLSATLGKKLALPARFARKGVKLSRTGQKVRKALYQGLGPATDPLAMYAKEVQANRLIGRLILPTDGVPKALAQEMKSTGLIDKALQAMGKEVSPATREWFLEKGYKKLVDVGGLRVGPLRFFAARGSFYNPSTTQLSGYTIGKALESGTPVHHAFAAGIIESKLWDEVVRKPLQAAFKPILDKFRRFKGASPEEKMILKSIFSSETRGREAAETLVGSIFVIPKGKNVQKLTVGGLTVKVPKEGIRRMTTNELRLVGQILHTARVQGKVGDNLELWIAEQLTKRTPKAQQWLKRTGLEKLPDRLVQPIARAARLAQDVMVDMGTREAERGMLKHFVDAYVPRMFKVVRKDLKDPDKLKAAIAREGGHWDIFKMRQTRFGDWEDNYNLFKSGAEEAIGILEDRADKLLAARLGAHFGQANFEDAVRQFYQVASKFPHRAGASKTWLAKQGLVGTIPQFAERAALAQAHRTIPGLPRSAVKQFEDILVDLRKTTISPEHAERNLQRLYEWAAKRRNLTPENVDKIMDEVKAVVAEKTALATDDAQKAVATLLQTGVKDLRNALTSQSLNKTFQRAIRNLRAEFGSPEPLHILSPSAKKVIDQTKKGVPGGWEKLDQEGLRQAIESTFERHATAINPNDVPRLRRQAFRRAKHIEDARLSAQQANSTLNELIARGTPRAKNDLFVRTVRTGTEAARKVEDRITKIYDDIERIAAKRTITGSDRVSLEFAWQELEALQKIRKDISPIPFWETLGQRRKELEELVSDVGTINKLAKEKGVRESLPAVISSLSPGGLEALEKGQRKTLIQWLKGGKFNERAAEYLTARSEPERALKLIRRQDIKVKSFVSGQEIPLSRVVGGSESMAKALEDMVLTRRRELGSLAPFFDKLEAGTGLLRKWFTGQLIPGIPILRPAFHIRNAVDLTIRNVMANGLRSLFDIDTWIDTWHILHGRTGSLKGMEGMTYESVRQLMRHSGQWSQKLGRFDFGESDKLFRRLKTATQLKAPALAGLKGDIAAYFERHPIFSRLGPRRIGVDMENFAATFNMVAALRNGMTPVQALEHSQTFLFFYGNMTAFERNVMRSLIPFWAFQRQAIGLIKWIAINKPRIFNYFPRIRDMAFPTTQEMAMMPDWVKDYPFVKIEEGKKGPRIISMRNVFSIDILPEILPKSWHELLSQVNPLVTAPIELAIGRDFYMLRDIKPVKILWNTMQSKASKEIWGILNPREVEIQGKKYVAVDGKMYHAITRLWFARLFRESDSAFALLEGKLGRTGLAGLLTGFKLIEVDRERQLNLLELDAARAYREYRKAVRSGDDIRAKQILDEMKLQW